MTLENTTKWIVNAVGHANIDGTVTLNDLRSGKHEMVAAVHFKGMSMLFLNPSTPIPETFDVLRHHVVKMQRKLETIGHACNISSFVSSEISKTGNSEAERTQGREIMSHFYGFLDQDIVNGGNVFENAL